MIQKFGLAMAEKTGANGQILSTMYSFDHFNFPLRHSIIPYHHSTFQVLMIAIIASSLLSNGSLSSCLLRLVTYQKSEKMRLRQLRFVCKPYFVGLQRNDDAT